MRDGVTHRIQRLGRLWRNQGSWRNLGNGPQRYKRDGYIHVSQVFKKFIRSLQISMQLKAI